MGKIDFSIIIVTYNSEKYIIPCINSIKSNINQISYEIIIIDNNSNDSTFKLVQQLPFSQIKLIKSDQNLGFASSCNMAASFSRGNIILFCNPDVLIMNDIFLRVRNTLKDNSIGCMSPKILRFDGSEAAFSFKFPHQPLLLVLAYFRKLLGKSNPRILQLNYFTKGIIIDCDWILGACFFIRRDLFFNIDGFDESFFLYFEDIDLCKRIKQAGFKIIADRNCFILHKFFGSSDSLDNTELIKIRRISEQKYYKKYYGWIGLCLATLLDRDVFIFRA